MEIKTVLSYVGASIPSFLILLLLVGAVMGLQPEPLALLALVVIQILWAAVWFGVPWAARKVGEQVAS